MTPQQQRVFALCCVDIRRIDPTGFVAVAQERRGKRWVTHYEATAFGHTISATVPDILRAKIAQTDWDAMARAVEARERQDERDSARSAAIRGLGLSNG